MQNSTLILVRHGESEGNRDRVFTQSPEVPITERGKRQAEAAARWIKERFRPQRLVCSPYLRARQTANILAQQLSLPVEENAAFREQSFGVFAGRPYEALLTDAAYHNGPRWAWRPRGGESLEDVAARVVPAVLDLSAQALGQEVVLVSHGGVMLAIIAHALGCWDSLTVPPNGGIVIMGYAAGSLSLRTQIVPVAD